MPYQIMASFWTGFVSNYLLDLGESASKVGTPLRVASPLPVMTETLENESMTYKPAKADEIQTISRIERLQKKDEIPIYGYWEEDEIEKLVA